MAYPIKNVVSCTSYTATISAIDINSATGNSNPTFNGKVFVTITPCPGDLNNVMVFTTAGVFQNAFCADELGAVYYYQNNNLYLTINSTASEQGFCFSALTNTNIIKTGNFALGVNQGGYGPTSSTAFWNGRPPNVSGYTAYVGNGTSSPTMYMLQNNTSVIQFATNLGCTYCTTIELSLFYILNSGTAICLNVEPPNIVTDGLVLYLDAGFTPSYPKGLATWYDMGPNLTNGTLTNGPTFSNDGGGSIVFDGSDDFVQIPYSTYWDTNVFGTATNFTLECWYKPDLFKNWDTLIEKSESSGWYSRSEGAAIWTDSGNIQGVFASGVDGNPEGSVVVLSYPTTTLKWYHIVFTGNGTVLSLYVDGVLRQTGLVSSRTVAVYNGSVGPRLGRRAFMDGQMSSVRFYTRALTQQDVLQNYYAGLQRFIPTDNMVLWLDGTNTNTRVITPTTAYDRSGGNYNGTLNNGVTLSHRDGGTVFSFDGVDDYIAISNPLNQSNLTQVWSVSVWVKQNTGTSGPQYIINGLNNGIASDWYGNGPLLYLNGGVNDYYTYTSTYASIAGTGWRHLVYLFQNSTGLRQIYKDGVLSGNSNGPNNTSTPSGQGGTWYIGQMSGKIGDVRIYSRVLTASEISTIYNAGRARYGV
jgi:hypothetical protein